MKATLLALFITLMAAITCLAQDSTNTSDSSGVITVSIVKLLASPEKYHQKKVQVIGYFRYDGSVRNIFLHKEDADSSVFTNSFWTFFSKSISYTYQKELHNQYVIIEGIFDMNNKGPIHMYGGAITEISRLDPWKINALN